MTVSSVTTSDDYVMETKEGRTGCRSQPEVQGLSGLLAAMVTL